MDSVMNLDEIIKYREIFNDPAGIMDKHDFAKLCMREAVKQALELAAERAEILDKETGISWMGILIDDEASYEVDKQSILSIIDEIE